MNRAFFLGAAVALVLLHTSTWAQGCKDFKWDVSREQTLFASKPASISAGADAAKAPSIETGKLYEISLAPQEQVRFVVEPGKKMIADGASAGLLHMRLPRAGKYRVAVSQAFWIDVVGDGKTIPSLDFSGSHDCEGLRKVVVYELPAEDLTLQLSGNIETRVLLSITPVTDKP